MKKNQTTKPRAKKHRKLKITGLALLALIVAGVAYTLISGYVKTLPRIHYDYYTGGQPAATYPDANFAVLSDLHYYDTSLGTTGAAYEADLHSDRKLLADSGDLLDYSVNDLLTRRPQFILVTGDLTKDGELIAHQYVAAQLQKLVDAGIKVYVIPGNHDVNNPGAVRYTGDKTEPVANISAADFARIYRNMGYGDAISRDRNSLSYVTQASDGLWVVAIDSCRYADNKPGGLETIGGKIDQGTEKWLAGVLAQAAREHKAVITIMHHGVIEHWNGQEKLHADYLVADYQHVGRFLASYHVGVCFTGHYHAQDITQADFSGGRLYDVETGSLVTPPCPIRYCNFSGGGLSIQTEAVVDKLHPGTDFAAKGAEFARSMVALEAYNTLRKYLVPVKDAHTIAAVVGDAFIAHYNGDEDPAKRPAFDPSTVGLWARIVYHLEAYVVDGLWHDLPPADNNVTLTMR
ncbi:MAG: metallophosphoesterase [Coriobacteriia bacterium]|nr:metallophosphoesterase [Coriobacteriia bacterium]